LGDAVRSAFIDGFHSGLYVGSSVLLVGFVAVVRWLPARARHVDIERQTAEYEALRVGPGDGSAAQVPEPVPS
jgi:hypothetical protein